MTSYSRNRMRDLSFHTGGTATYVDQRYLNGSPFGSPSSILLNGSNVLKRTGHEVCDDYVSDSTPYPDHPLQLVKKKCRKIGSISGDIVTQYPSSSGWSNHRSYQYEKFCPPKWYHDTYAPDSEVGDWDYWKTEALANANPYSPVVDVPLFIYEFKDFPRMLRQLGRALKGSIPGKPSSFRPAEINLAYQLGWKPLVNDLVTLLQLTPSLYDRMEYIRNLSGKGKTVHRRVHSSTSQNSRAGDYLNGITYDIKRTRQHDVWYTLRYRSASGALPPALTLRSDVQDIITGLRTLRPATIWNAIPWTWLIDYFVNVGSFIEANEGRYLLQPEYMNLMQKELITEELMVVENQYGLDVSPFKFETASKCRRVYVNPRASLAFDPILNGRQMGIIASLVAAGPTRAYHRG